MTEYIFSREALEHDELSEALEYLSEEMRTLLDARVTAMTRAILFMSNPMPEPPRSFEWERPHQTGGYILGSPVVDFRSALADICS